MHIPAFTLLYGGSHEGFSAPLKQSSRSADVASYGAVRIPDFLAGELRDSSCRRGTKGTRATVFSGEPWPGASARPLSGKGARVDCLFLPRRSVVSRGGQNPPHALRRNRPCFSAAAPGPSPWSGEFHDRAEDRWLLEQPLYGGVVYRSLYPGIDMVYGADGRNLKSEFVVAPRAEPSAIRVRKSP